MERFPRLMPVTIIECYFLLHNVDMAVSLSWIQYVRNLFKSLIIKHTLHMLFQRAQLHKSHIRLYIYRY